MQIHLTETRTLWYWAVMVKYFCTMSTKSVVIDLLTEVTDFLYTIFNASFNSDKIIYCPYICL